MTDAGMYFRSVDEPYVERTGRASSEDEALRAVQHDLVEEPEPVDEVRRLVALESPAFEYPGLHHLTVVPARLLHVEPVL